MAKQELTCDDILKELRAKQYRPIYYLMGEESYYIDLTSGRGGNCSWNSFSGCAFCS